METGRKRARFHVSRPHRDDCRIKISLAMLFAVRRFSIGVSPYFELVEMSAQRIRVCWTSSCVFSLLKSERNLWQPMLPTPYIWKPRGNETSLPATASSCGDRHLLWNLICAVRPRIERVHEFVFQNA
jgi:hypothetical protein